MSRAYLFRFGLVLFVSGFILLRTIYQLNLNLSVHKYYERTQATKRCLPFGPLILVWTPYFGRTDIEEMLILPSAGNENCEVTVNRGRIAEADAVLFHAWPGDLRENDFPKRLEGNSKQVWIFMAKESPYLTPTGLEAYDKGIFNWTMTYRLDSDVTYFYGSKVKLGKVNETQRETEEEKIQELIKGKQALLAGVTSKCSTSSKREILISELEQFLSLELFGDCGAPIPKEREKDSQMFWKGLGSTYKFYLAFENALCVDYVTEKLWRTLELGMVPVVYGAADYSKLAPPNSFIDAKAFNSTKELANYLLKLDNDPVEYRKYFEWRKEFRIQSDEGFAPLCRKLKDFKLSDKKSESFTKPKFNLKDWWINGGKNGASSCSPPKYS